jgi:hypothetical protein
MGWAIRRRLPAHHLTDETKSLVSVSMAVVATVSALVLGLLITNANTSWLAAMCGFSLVLGACLADSSTTQAWCWRHHVCRVLGPADRETAHLIANARLTVLIS